MQLVNYFCMLTVVFLVLSVNAIQASPEKNNNFKRHTWPSLKRSSGTNCDNVYTLLCLKLDAVSFVERLADSGEYPIFPGVTIIKERNTNKTEDVKKATELARKFPDDPDERLKSYAYYKLLSYLDTHSLNLRMANHTNTDMRGAYKKKFWETVMMVKSTLMTLLIGISAFKTGISVLFSTSAIFLAGFMALQIYAMGHEGFDLFAKFRNPPNSNGWSGSYDSGAYTNGFHGGWTNGNGGGVYHGNFHGPSGNGYGVPFYDDYRPGGPYSRIGHEDDSVDSIPTN